MANRELKDPARLVDLLSRRHEPGVRDQIVMACMPLINKQARKYKVPKGCGIDHEDKVNAAVVALLEALDRYDLSKGWFTGWARLAIRAAMLREIGCKAGTIKVPRRAKAAIAKAKATGAEVDPSLADAEAAERVHNNSVEQAFEVIADYGESGTTDSVRAPTRDMAQPVGSGDFTDRLIAKERVMRAMTPRNRARVLEAIAELELAS